MKEETRYLFSKGDLIRSDFSITLKRENQKPFHIPILDTKEIYCFNDLTITTKLLEILSRSNIIVHFFGYNENYSGTFYPKEKFLSGKLLIKQVDAYNNYNKRLEIAKSIILGISKNIHFTLYHYYRHGKSDLKFYLDWLKNDFIKYLTKAENIKQVLAIEGNMWAKFYSSFKFFLLEDFVINKRVKRPPDNPINALISFGNTLLYTKTITQIYNTHLNQSISYLHEPSTSRFSLSLDLSETFKPILVFKTIFDCVNNKKLVVEKHFEKKYNYCILNEEGKKIFISSFENRLNETIDHPILKRKVTYKQLIKIDGYKLTKYLMEDKKFIPFILEDKK